MNLSRHIFFCLKSLNRVWICLETCFGLVRWPCMKMKISFPHWCFKQIIHFLNVPYKFSSTFHTEKVKIIKIFAEIISNLSLYVIQICRASLFAIIPTIKYSISPKLELLWTKSFLFIHFIDFNYFFHPKNPKYSNNCWKYISYA